MTYPMHEFQPSGSPGLPAYASESTRDHICMREPGSLDEMRSPVLQLSNPAPAGAAPTGLRPFGAMRTHRHHGDDGRSYTGLRPDSCGELRSHAHRP